MTITENHIDLVVDLQTRVAAIFDNPYAVSIKEDLYVFLAETRDKGIGDETRRVADAVQRAEAFLGNIALAYQAIGEQLQEVRSHELYYGLYGNLRTQLDADMPPVTASLKRDLENLKRSIEFAVNEVLPRFERHDKFQRFIMKLSKSHNWAASHRLFSTFVEKYPEWKNVPVLTDHPTQDQIDEVKRFVEEFQNWIDSGVELLYPNTNRTLNRMGFSPAGEGPKHRPKKPGSAARRRGERSGPAKPKFKKGGKQK